MCNRARQSYEPETLHTSFATVWGIDRPVDNRFNPRELTPRSRAYVVRENDRGRGLDIMSWDVLGGGAAWPMTNVRNLGLPQWRRLAEGPENPLPRPADRVLRMDAGAARPRRWQKAREGRNVVPGPRSAVVRRRRLLAADYEGRGVHDGNLRSERVGRADPSKSDGHGPTRG